MGNRRIDQGHRVIYCNGRKKTGQIEEEEMHNKPRPSRIECESQGTFFTAFAMNLQTVIFFLDDMISFPTSELFLMAPTAPSCHR